MILYIVRHAWAGHFGDPEWPDDFQRPLSREGAERFAALVKKLAGRGFAPQLVATSPLIRCAQTAELIVQAVDKAKLVELDALTPDGDPAQLIAWTAKQSRRYDQIAWVGHEPRVGQLAAAMIGDSSANIRFAKGAVAALKFSAKFRPAEAELRWLANAKMLGC